MRVCWKQHVLVNEMLEGIQGIRFPALSPVISVGLFSFCWLLNWPCSCHTFRGPTLYLLVSHSHHKFAGDLDHELKGTSAGTDNELEHSGSHSWATNQSSLPVQRLLFSAAKGYYWLYMKRKEKGLSLTLKKNISQNDTIINKNIYNQDIPKFVHFHWNIVLSFSFNKW